MSKSLVRPVAIKLGIATHDRLKRLAEAQHRTPHWLMRQAIEEYVEREERRDALRRDALAAWEHYQATGLHLTQAETDEWLTRLQADPQAEPPECHR